MDLRTYVYVHDNFPIPGEYSSYRVTIIIIIRVSIYHDYQHIPHTKFLGHRIEHHILTLFHHFQQALKLDANFIVEAWSYNIVKEILHPFTL